MIYGKHGKRWKTEKKGEKGAAYVEVDILLVVALRANCPPEPRKLFSVDLNCPLDKLGLLEMPLAVVQRPSLEGLGTVLVDFFLSRVCQSQRDREQQRGEGVFKTHYGSPCGREGKSNSPKFTRNSATGRRRKGTKRRRRKRSGNRVEETSLFSLAKNTFGPS